MTNTIKRFEDPDEVRRFSKGRFEVLRIGGVTLGRAVYEPGWRWSEHVGPQVGARTCDVEHLGIVVSGHAKVKMTRGEEYDLRAGDVFHIAAGHDSWVVGAEPDVSLHLLGASDYAHGRGPDRT